MDLLNGPRNLKQKGEGNILCEGRIYYSADRIFGFEIETRRMWLTDFSSICDLKPLLFTEVNS